MKRQQEADREREREITDRIAEGVKRDLAPRPHGATEPPVRLQDLPGATQPAHTVPEGATDEGTGSPGPVRGESRAVLLRRLRAGRRAEGACADCGAHSGDAYRCPACSAARTKANARAASRRRIGRALEGQIETAAARGRGVRLSAADVRRLAGGRSEVK